MAIYEHLRCGRFRSNGIPYKTDLLADYLSDDSTWNDSGSSLYVAGSANIPSICNGIKTNGAETVNGIPTPVIVSQRLVAEGDGVSDYIDYGLVNICGSGASSFQIEFILGDDYVAKTGNSFIVSEYYSTTRGWGLYIPSTLDDKFKFIMGQSDGSFKGDYTSDAGLTLSKGDRIKVTFEADGTDGLISFFQNDTAIGTASVSGQNKVYSTGAKLVLMANQNGASEFFGSSYFNLGITVDSVVELNCTLEGHVYDTSGNGNHGTNSGVDLTAVVNDRDNGVYSGLLREGFDLYLDDATSLISYYVPYVNGSPVVSSVSGYTKQSERPALEKGCNNAPVKFTFPINSYPTGLVMDATCSASTPENIYVKAGTLTADATCSASTPTAI